MNVFSVERLKELLEYDPETGIFIWKVRDRKEFKSDQSCCSWNTQYSGKPAGSEDRRGYISIGIEYKSHLAHRLAWFYMTGDYLEDHIDHINGIKSDNRFVNLRKATSGENSQNVKKAMSTNLSGLLGVQTDISRYNGRVSYRAKIQVNGVTHKLGTFTTPEEAHQAYLNAKREFHPFNTL